MFEILTFSNQKKRISFYVAVEDDYILDITSDIQRGKREDRGGILWQKQNSLRELAVVMKKITETVPDASFDELLRVYKNTLNLSESA